MPYGLGALASHLPYRYRPGIGKTYHKRAGELIQYETLSSDEKQNFIFSRMKNIVDFAYKRVPFYKTYYDSCNFLTGDLKSFDDLKNIPVINKSLLQSYDLEARSTAIDNRYTVNTGGSTGQPLSFYILPDSMGHEWAHMHKVWKKLGYKSNHLKLTFVGRGDFQKAVEYDGVRHQLNVSIYENLEKIAIDLKNSKHLNKVKYLHGYPSAIYEFATYCENHDTELRDCLRKTLKGVFFGSEFPNELWRNMIEKVFCIDSISWYGHTERAVLAYEVRKKYQYKPFQTYGYAESVEIEGESNLVGTTYYNFASPLIRYNTEDQISDLIYQDGIMSRFRVAGGRQGEYIIDMAQKKIPLTGFIYGRHHKLFDFCKYMQVRQTEIGKAEILCVPNGVDLSTIDLSEQFDKGDVNIELNFVVIGQPIKTMSGKVKLLVD